jgi:hypothetical protein
VQTEGGGGFLGSVTSENELAKHPSQKLVNFLRTAVPRVTACLAENERSASFQTRSGVMAGGAHESDESKPECVYVLDPRPVGNASTNESKPSTSGKTQSRDDKFWRHLVPTAVSWSSSGDSIFVSYGRFDTTGWCDSSGALCAWNLRKQNVDSKKPDHVFETDSALQCVRSVFPNHHIPHLRLRIRG